ncbi:MAG: hypothetical protein R3B13_25365 [Polyangiaceae bacterium]
MLLIGSRAIVHYFPDFRPPRDWDLFGTGEEVAMLAQRLPPMEDKSPQPHKSHFYYGDAMVEVVDIDHSPEWAKVYEAFRDQPTIDDPVLGTLTLAPPAFLMLTKQTGLIYRILHWHKNLEDLYFLRDRITSVPDIVAQVMPYVLADSRKLFAESTAEAMRAVEPCYVDDPTRAWAPRTPLHSELHALLAGDGHPLVSESGAWQGYPDATPEARRERMIRLFAEEATVLAAERWLTRGFHARGDDERTATRWGVRNLIQSRLPEGWRYFGVNHYREIIAGIPSGWSTRIESLRERYPRPETPCTLTPVELDCAACPTLTSRCGEQRAWAGNAASPHRVRACR